MLTRDCNLSEEYRVEWPFFMFSKTTEITYQSSKYPPATSSSGDAYATNRGVPPSCDCWETGRGDSDCEVFDCTCICDLTAGECDHNCCCDKECDEAQRQRFDAIQACLPEGTQNGEITRCYSTKDVDQVNPKFPLSTRGTARGSVDRMLCVQYDNSNSQRKFYKDPNLLSASTVDKELAQTELGYSQWKASLPVIVDRYYDSGDSIGAVFSSIEADSALVAAFAGSLPLPTNTQLGECSEYGLAQFATATTTKCIRVFDAESLSRACQIGILGISRFTTKLRVGSSFTTSHGSMSDAGSNWVNVAVDHMSWQNFTTGELSRPFQGKDCESIYDSGTEPLTSALSSEESTTPCLIADAQRPPAPACRNTIASIKYTIHHNGDVQNKGKQQIVAVNATIVLTDIPAAVTDEDGLVVVQQEYSVQFRSDADVPPSMKSGNPGYIFGRPIPVIPHRIGYLGVLGAIADEACTDHKINMVTFGVNVHSGCLLKLNRSELRDFCVGNGPHAAGKGLPRYFNTSHIFNAAFEMTDYRVGIFGNAADPRDNSQWLKLPRPTRNDADWQERSGSCKNAITSMNYRFIWTYVGAQGNPQAKIIGARISFGTSDINYHHSTVPSTSQSISITATATFVKKDSDFVDYSPPSPPVAISVPHDVWYPFKIDSHSDRRTPFLSLTWIFAASLIVAN